MASITTTSSPSPEDPSPGKHPALPEVDKATFHMLVDDAIHKQIQLGRTQRRLHSILVRHGDAPDAMDAIARAGEEARAAQEDSERAISRLSEFLG